jgi:hypothetical protein
MSADRSPETTMVDRPRPKCEVLLRNQKYLRDPAGRPITDGACVIDADNEIGYVRLELAPVFLGPESWDWDGWFHVTRTRSENPLRGKLANGERVQVLSRADR